MREHQEHHEQVKHDKQHEERRARRPAPKAVGWSYIAGAKGENRVRVYERGDRPGIWIDYRDEQGARCRHALGAMDQEAAKAKADEIAAQFRRETRRRPAELTLADAVSQYAREVTTTKSATAQAHDRRTFALFLALFGADRKPATLSRRDWDAYIAARRAGRLVPAGVKLKDGQRHTVRDRVLEQDLNLLQALLNWCVQAGDGEGHYLLERNPLKGLKPPAEVAPRRALLTRAQYERVRDAARTIGPRVECLTVLVWETGHRSASVRQLRWSDVDLERERIHFRGELDKIGLDHWNPLSHEAVAMLKRERKSEPRIGDGWIFPSPRDRERRTCLTRDAVANLWVRIATAAELPTGERYGWHSLRRAFANRLRRAPLKDLQGLGGWKTAATLLDVYLQHDEDAQREALLADSQPPAAPASEAAT